ncbi:hypothetical protein [Ostreiculturibacter nitratireducens]|uniref:hypothetical protein n=1 Tax=Ostreiculturibacter nitratireducens TaxID=3075226 RepID=UPI0031B58C0E
MRLIWFFRMAKWARHPPSARRVVFILSIIAICLALAGAEWLGLFPEGFGGGRFTGRVPKVQTVP